MVMKIPTASETWQKQQNKGDFDRACESVLREIEKAQKIGRRDACFDPRPCEQYDAVKREFERHGYTFRPTGYIGGVWQHTEHICW